MPSQSHFAICFVYELVIVQGILFAEMNQALRQGGVARVLIVVAEITLDDMINPGVTNGLIR